MLPETFETKAHTTRDGTLNLSMSVGVADADVSVTVLVRPVEAVANPDCLDENGWPEGFFERVAGSMPELERAPQGNFDERQRLE